MSRFFVKPENIRGVRALLDGPQSRHLSKVLRLGTGDEVVLFDGSMEYVARIVSVDSKSVSLEITGELGAPPRLAFSLTLVQAVIKIPRMDTAIEKATELGVTRIKPMQTHRCVPLPSDSSTKIERWRKIAESAAAQCGRVDVPAIDPWLPFDEVVRDEYDLAVMLYERDRLSGSGELLSRWESVKNEVTPEVALMVGPEGGFTDDEVAEARRRGWISWGLGALILRAETASIAGVAVLNHILKR